MADFGIGIQLYTVRDYLDKDFKGTLTKLAQMGYQGVEFAMNYGKMSPEELAAFVKGLGLRCCGMHLGLDDLCNPQSEGYKYAKAMSTPCVTTSIFTKEMEKEWAGLVKRAGEAGKVAKSLGFTFTYHNHAHEFIKIDGVYALDMMYRDNSADAVQGELDTFWIKKGGEDPVAYIRKYAGRVPQIHLKDMNPATKEFTEVGTGCMDLPAIFALAKEIKAKWVIVEQDVCKDSLESARIAIENIKKQKLS